MFSIGDKLFLRTVTYHLVGEVEQIEGDWVKLKDASWVADSGRFSQALENGNSIQEVEYVGEAYVNLSTCTDAFPWRHKLPLKTR